MSYKVVGKMAEKLILRAGATAFFGVAFWLFLTDKTATGIASAGVGAIVFFMANLDQIETFKGFGLEAKTRDIRQAIEDAESTIAQLEAMSDQIKSQSDSIMLLQNILAEKNSMAERAHAMSVTNL